VAVLGILLLTLISVIAMYNTLIALRHQIQNAWKQIDVQIEAPLRLDPNRNPLS
jgi:hypothetical protein